jgi:tRNA uridine 5-carboxymethylaminomethyl modification enzyme
VDDERWSCFQGRSRTVEATLALLATTRIDGGALLSDVLRRSDVTWDEVAARHDVLATIPRDIGRLVEIRIKYEGYLARQDRQIERLAKMESKLIPTNLDYSKVVGLRNEARTKLAKFTPRSLGQALRISGITPADITVLAVHIDRGSRRGG